MSTNVVAEIWREGNLPAARPIDHARRVCTGTLWGLGAGVVLGLIAFPNALVGSRALYLIPAFAVVAFLLALPWLIRDKTPAAPGVDVVARVLGTDESRRMRTVGNSRRKQALMVPVVVRPVDKSADFRTVIAVHGAEQAGFAEGKPGTLLPLRQTEKGYGGLANVEEASPEQEALMRSLEQRPKLLPNTAPVLPFKPQSLDRVTTGDQLEWWGGMIAGALLAAVIMGIVSLL